MIRPKKLGSGDLQHPKSKGTEYIGPNGDKRVRGTRWNGAADWEQRESFNTRVTVTDGTKAPSGVSGNFNRVGAVQALPSGHTYSPASRPPKEPFVEPKSVESVEKLRKKKQQQKR